MSSPIAQAFCLNDGRRNFKINVRSSLEDRRIYFGNSHLQWGRDRSISVNVEQRFGAAALPELRGNLDTDTGDFGLEFGDIGFELLDPHQRQILWLRRFARAVRVPLRPCLPPSPVFPAGTGII